MSDQNKKFQALQKSPTMDALRRSPHMGQPQVKSRPDLDHTALRQYLEFSELQQQPWTEIKYYEVSQVIIWILAGCGEYCIRKVN